jgi:hypothetical protein
MVATPPDSEVLSTVMNPADHRRRRRDLLVDAGVVSLCASLAVFLFLDSLPLETWDETVYCDATANMLRHGADGSNGASNGG